MDGILVINMRTGDVATYKGTSAEVAVWLAHQQLTLGLVNWWESTDDTARISKWQNFVMCGEWTARKAAASVRPRA